MARMLRHTPTGDLYIYTDALAKRKDMELVVEEPVVAEAIEEKPKKAKRAKKVATVDGPADETVEDAVEEDPDEPADEDE